MAGTLNVDYFDPGWTPRLRTFSRGVDRINFANFVDVLAGIFGRRTAFVLDRTIDEPGFKGEVLSFNDVQRLVNRLGGSLRALGVEPGDRVCLMTANRVEMAFCSFAAAKIGAIPVPINFMLRPPEIDHVVRTAGAKVLVCDRDVFEGCIRDTTSVPAVAQWVMIGEDAPPWPFVSMRSLMREGADDLDPVLPASEDDPAMLFFTSGTTGFPKGATLSQASMMAGVRWVGKMELGRPRLARNLSLLVMPVAHSGGYVAMLHYMTTGTPCYFMSRFNPVQILDTIEQHHVSTFTGTPAIYRMLLDAGAADRDLTSVRVWGGGADAFDDPLVRKFRDLAGRKTALGITRKPMFIRGYGMAEANSHVGMSPPWAAGDNCLGWILPPLRYRIVDEGGRDVPAGSAGELLLKGSQVMKGYWNDPEATAAALQGGWFHTGDIVRRGRWRMLFFVGRGGDVIKSGGYKISSAEIDAVVGSHPDVDQVATVGIPDPVKGERPVTAITLRKGSTATAESIHDWARERMAPYKCPRRIVVLDSLPMTMSLKIKRGDVRATLQSMLERETAATSVASPSEDTA